MMPTPRSALQQPGSNSTTKPKPILEILPDERFIVFGGNEHEASSVTLTGRIRLTTPEPISILKPKVRLEGKRKIRFYCPPNNYGVNHRGVAEDKRVFWNTEQKLGVDTAHKVKAGVMEWPFSFELSPSMPESVEGLRETFIAYHLHASVSRPGWNTRDITASEHIRLVRTIGPETMGMSRSRVNSDIWSNKISYSISIPSDAIVFGTSIVADVELSPIKKGLRLGKVELRLVETIVKRIQVAEMPDSRHDTTGSDEIEVAKADMEFPEDSRVVYEGETADNPTLADEMYKFKAALPLPKSLHDCRQDVDSHQLNISHRFKLMVNIHNPEGHVSQLVCRLPVKLFISPNLPLDDNNMVLQVPGRMTDEQLNDTETVLVAPPEYGRHQLDAMFSDIDPSGFMSVAASVPGTPAGYAGQSRRGSADNLISLNGLVDGLADVDLSSETHGSAVPHQLRARLATLQENGTIPPARYQSVTFADASNTSRSPVHDTADPANHTSSSAGGSGRHTPTPVRNTSGYFSGGTRFSPQASAPASGRTSDEDHTADIQQRHYDMNDLTRVPSYGAALRTSGSATPFTEGPPSYAIATSRPPSPGPAHVRNRGAAGSSTPASAGSQQTLSAAPLGAVAPNLTRGASSSVQRQPSDTTTSSAVLPGPRSREISDEEARLQRIRAGD